MMIDNETGLEMTPKYEVVSKNASCNVEFDEEFTDDGQHFLSLVFSFGSTFSDEMDFSELKDITEEAKSHIYRLNTIRKLLEGRNWIITLEDDIVFRCYHEIDIKDYYCRDHTNSVDLGKIAECYDDCDNCDKYCYSFKNDSPFENKCDCPNYLDCADIYGNQYDEDGEEYYDPLWHHRCYCVRINGRDKLLKALGGKKCI